jgi:hypothetical protein
MDPDPGGPKPYGFYGSGSEFGSGSTTLESTHVRSRKRVLTINLLERNTDVYTYYLQIHLSSFLVVFAL